MRDGAGWGGLDTKESRFTKAALEPKKDSGVFRAALSLLEEKLAGWQSERSGLVFPLFWADKAEPESRERENTALEKDRSQKDTLPIMPGIFLKN